MEKIKAAVKIKAAAEKIKAAAEKIKAPLPPPEKIKAAEKIKADLADKIKAFLGTITGNLLDSATQEKIKNQVTPDSCKRFIDESLFPLLEKCECYLALPEDYQELNENYGEIRREMERLEGENTDLRRIAAQLKMENDKLNEQPNDELVIKQSTMLIQQNKDLLDKNKEVLDGLKTFEKKATELLKKLNGEVIKYS
ncbi:MAG TPA: hypothetical protein VFH08_01625 [Chitinophagaceae bacterium]|nr:hypothetical protein [Chitinophagaceae bacterium]